MISRIRERAYSLIGAELEKAGIRGIVPSHGSILITLYREDRPLAMKEIAERIGKTQPTVTVLVEKLIEHGFVTREKDSRDARRHFVQLTDRGREFKNTFFEISNCVNERLFAGFSNLEQELLEKLLQKMLDNL